jgi:hypothetical protein
MGQMELLRIQLTAESRWWIIPSGAASPNVSPYDTLAVLYVDVGPLISRHVSILTQEHPPSD